MRNWSFPHHPPEHDVSADAGGWPARLNRRRLAVFGAVFLVVLLPGLAWDFLRPAEYRATAKLQITPGSSEPRPSPLEAGEPPSPRVAPELLTQVQILTSRPLLEKVGEALARAGLSPAAAGSPVAQLKEMIEAVPVAGTEVVELRATGAPPALLAAALNSLVEAYREQMQAAHGVAANEGLTQAREEAESLGQAVRERRQRLDAFRHESGVVSPEREENEAVLQIKGLTMALNTAVERAAVAEARLRALRETLAGGRGGAPAKDDPTLAGIEQRASQLREEMREMERTYTPEFLRIDPRARALRARLNELEQQVESQRLASRQGALAAAQEESASARATVDRLQGQIAAQRASLQRFSQRFMQAKSLADDLAQIEQARRAALERLARIEASERSHLPVLGLIEAASVPQSPFRPDYLGDALLVLAAAFGLGVLAIGFVELFTRRPPAPAPATTTVLMAPHWAQLPAAGQAAAFLPAADSRPLGRLAGQSPALRELTQAEALALLTAAAGEARCVVALFLMGLGVDEVLALRRDDFDPVAGTLRVVGSAPRTLPTPDWLAACCPPPGAADDAPLVHDAAGAPIGAADLRSLLACAAFDAGLAGAAGLTPEDLRHTCIAWLVRQGVRFADLAALVGRPSADALATYADLAPAGPRLALAEVRLLMPALQAFAES